MPGLKIQTILFILSKRQKVRRALSAGMPPWFFL